jgi:uncharacterized membrane protein YjjP (DUF1212 family)
MERPHWNCALLWLLDRATQLTNLKRETPCPEPLTRESALKTTALAATLLFAYGQTIERTVIAAERLGRALGVTVKVLPYWDEITVELDGAPISQIVPAKPLGVDMGSVLAVTTVIDRVLSTPVVDRLHLPFAAAAFSAVVSLMPGFFLFNAATGFVELISIGPSAPAALLMSIATRSAAAFLIIMAMIIGLILPACCSSD